MYWRKETGNIFKEKVIDERLIATLKEAEKEQFTYELQKKIFWQKMWLSRE